MLLVSRLILSAIIVYSFYLIWTRDVNLIEWLKITTEKVLPIIENKSSVKIVFDHENSTACLIDSDQQKLKDKLCFLLYRIGIVGKSDRTSYVKNIHLTIYCNDQWVEGKRLYPTQRKQTDKNGRTEKCVQLNIINQDSIDRVFLGNWEEFKPQEKGLEYGEPKTFSYATVFDIKEKYKYCSKLRITIDDYLGNKFQETIDIRKYIKKAVNQRLIQN